MLRKIICSCCGRILWTAFGKGIDKCDACETAKTAPVVGHKRCANGA
jgi:hypothetical protein